MKPYKRRFPLDRTTKKSRRDARAAAKLIGELPNPAAVQAIQDGAAAMAESIDARGSLGTLTKQILPASILLQIATALKGAEAGVLGTLEIDGKSVPVRTVDVQTAGMAAFAKATMSMMTEMMPRLLEQKSVKARLFDNEARAAAASGLVPATPPAGGGKTAERRRGRRKGTKKRAGRVK